MKLLAISILASFLCLGALAQDIPVDPCTGRPAINIPLCQVNDRSLSHNVGLVYNASGVKVDDQGGKVGQNWSLIAGGEVRRELRGLPDDYYSGTLKGWLHNSNASSIGNYGYPADEYATSCPEESPVYNFINNFNHITDTEPDLFHFSAGDISGTFVFDNTGNIDSVRLIPYQDVRVKPYRVTSASPIIKFEIITAGGIKYIFDVQETSTKKTERVVNENPFHFRREYHQYKNGVNYTRKWKLREIVSSVGEKISFMYNPKSVDEASNVTVLIKDTGTGVHRKVQYTTTEAVDLQVLNRIQTLHQQVFLESVNAPTTDHVLLKTIIIQEINTVTATVKTIDLEYANIRSTHPDHPNDSRIFLRKITISDNCQEYEPYSFQYHGVSFALCSMRLPMMPVKPTMKRSRPAPPMATATTASRYRIPKCSP